MGSFPRILALAFAALLASCGSGREGALQVAFIDSEEELFDSGLFLSESAQHVRAATHSGLVALDPQGEVIPALADQWIITNDGRSFIFRLRDGTWPDGSPLTAESVRLALQRRIDVLSGTSLGLDLAPILEVRAMAGRVIELRLAGAEPSLLQLLAQPELALSRGDAGTGPMVLDSEADPPALQYKPPDKRGLPLEEDWAENVTPIGLHAAGVREAVAMFDNGVAEVVLGGGIGGLPLVDTGPLSRGTVRLDPAIGLFGLQVRRATGPLSTPQLRESIAMALDRAALIEPFGVGGWTPTNRVVGSGLPGDLGLIEERWEGESLAELRERAARRISAWRARAEDLEPEEPIRLTVSLGEEPGHDLLFRELFRQFAQIGLTLERAENVTEADLVLVDRVARYAGPRWYLNQFNCALRRGLCNQDADFLVGQAMDDQDPRGRATLLAEAETELTLDNVYIPFGPPIRWSLVRSSVDNYAANRWAFHPLPPMAQIPR